MMRTLAYYMVVGALAAVLSGCMGGWGPEVERTGKSLVTLEADELPADLDECQTYFGPDGQWDTPEAVYRVGGRPGTVVFVQDGAPVCQTPVELVRVMLPGFEIGPVVRTNGMGGESAEDPVDDSNPLPATPKAGGSVSTKGPADDSNPLPATPVGGESADSSGGADDSNPLPALPIGTGTASSGGVAGDSNPLPARTNGKADRVEFGPEHSDPFSEL
ncbi:MAG: hypothetical protein ABI333_07070 [bacterium]